MNLSICLLTASWLAGGPGDVPTYANSGMPSTQPQVIYYAPSTEEKHGPFSGLRDRMHQFFSGPAQDGYTTMPAGQVIQTGYAPMPQGTVQMIQPQPAPTAEPPADAAAQPQLALKKEYQKKVGNADDYSWITGQLFYVHSDGGVWVVRYAPLGEEDRYGGSVVLAPAVNMKNFREGDLVCVNGEVLSQGRASRHLGGALYRATHIEMIDRVN